MALSRRDMLRASVMAAGLGSIGSVAMTPVDTLILHEGDAPARAWLADLQPGSLGRIEMRQVALLHRGAVPGTARWLSHFSQRRLLALVGDGEAMVLEAVLRQIGATVVAFTRFGQRIQIDARI